VKHNLLKDKIAKREPAIGAAIGFPSPDLVDFLGFAGFEWIFIDAEHGPIGWNECQAMCQVCDSHGMSSIVRVHKLDHELIMTYLQTGVMGVAVPHVNTVAQAEAVVKAARYAPQGRRGCDAGARSSGYGLQVTDAEYFARSNTEVLVAVWVEEVEGMQNLDEILRVPGIDAVHFGSGDLALSMGLPGRSDDPRVQQAVVEGRRKVLASGKALIGEPADAETAKRMIEDGVLLISTQVSSMWQRLFSSYLAEVKPRTPKTSAPGC
jgi:2-keto-3-deoxy-L-rhamnonate aldolase RhmA